MNKTKVKGRNGLVCQTLLNAPMMQATHYVGNKVWAPMTVFVASQEEEI